VPAVSTRCRMCGASLDASSKVEDEEEGNRKSGRVRQRTMSSNADNQMASTRDHARDDNPEAEDPIGGVAEQGFGDSVENDDADTDVDDPLSAYIEEVDISDDNLTGEVEKLDPIGLLDPEPEAADDVTSFVPEDVPQDESPASEVVEEAPEKTAGVTKSDCRKWG